MNNKLKEKIIDKMKLILVVLIIGLVAFFAFNPVIIPKKLFGMDKVLHKS